MNREHEASQYAADYLNPWYGMGVARKADVARLLSDYACDSLLDVGTGRGEALAIAELLCGFSETMGTETDESLCGKNIVLAYAHDLPFDDESYELVTCFDVLEHMIEDDLIPAVREFVRVASQKVIVSAAEFSFVYNGREQHISRRPAGEWQDLISEAAAPHKVERCGMAGDSPAWIITKVSYGH